MGSQGIEAMCRPGPLQYVLQPDRDGCKARNRSPAPVQRRLPAPLVHMETKENMVWLLSASHNVQAIYQRYMGWFGNGGFRWAVMPIALGRTFSLR